MQYRTRYILLLLTISLFGLIQDGYAQFYNGHQMRFGKNRIQYARGDVLESDFYASFFRFDRFDVYFYPNGQELAEYLSKRAQTELTRLQNYFEYSVDKRVIFIVFNKLTDFRQSNIGLITGMDETNIGGVTRINDNKVFVYFDGNYRSFDQQITEAITEVILQEMLYAGNVRERVASSTMLNLPEWYYRGLLAYVSRGWDVETDDRVRDGITSGNFEKFNQLTGDDAVYAGHSIWNFIGETFGASVIPTIVYFTRVNRNVASGFLNVLGMSLTALSYEWHYFYQKRYDNPAYSGDIPPDSGIKMKKRRNLKYLRARISPDGNYVAYTSNQNGRIKVHLYDEQTGKSRVIYRQGAKLGQINDYSYPVIEWHPSGQLLAMTTEYKGTLRFSVYPFETGKWEHSELELFEKVLDFSYADDGLNIVLSGVVNGQSDLYVHNLVAHTNERLTNDRADDLAPRFINRSSQVVFTSNRRFANLKEQEESDEVTTSYDLYVYEYDSRSNVLTPLAEDPVADRFQPTRLPDDRYVFLGDDTGIRNRYMADYDSAIVSIDTTIHYRYFSDFQPISRYGRSILDQSVSTQTGDFTDLFFYQDRYRIHKGFLSAPEDPLVLENTPVRERFLSERRRKDSLAAATQDQYRQIEEARQVIQLGADSLPERPAEIDINNYVFESERNLAQGQTRRLENWLSRLRDPLGQPTFEFPQVRIYQPSFYINYLASLVDFNFLNASYQPFTGTGFYNPGLNIMSKVGTRDLFEDYKITGGVRFGSDFDSNEYLLSLEILKKRLDQEVIFHRMVYKTPTYDYTSLVRSTTQEVMYLLKYPFSQVSSVRSMLTARYDNYTFLSTDQQNMVAEGVSKFWGGLKLEYVYDNTVSPVLNLHEGLRYKIFGEYYQQIRGDFSDVFIVGADLRHYLPLHRTLTWANRVAGSTSFGSGRLIYYMGGVDNWLNISQERPTFDPSVPIDTTQNFVYQALATNMRGFSQNIRNGNSFVVYNTEIRWPVIRYFANRPINSDFLSSLQLVGFFDVGTAWSGPTPWDDRNHLNRKIIEKGPIIAEIETGNVPWVAGFGAGLRARLLGYFIRLDWAWGIENYVLLPRMFYLSLSMDF